jgi:TPR repeat protein
MELEYLDLLTTKLAFESAYLGLIEVYMGEHGRSHENPELALQYMRSGAALGFPAAQRKLAIVMQFGLLGVPKNEIEATILLGHAAANGDTVARTLLRRLIAYQSLHAWRTDLTSYYNAEEFS